MARILMAPFSQALIVESPNAKLDDHLDYLGIASERVDKIADEDELIHHLNRTGAQVLFKRSRVPVTRKVVENCPNLFVVQLCCIGDDSVDKPACADNGVLVFNDPVSNGRSVVELAIGHLIALSRRLFETDVATHANKWEKNNKGRYEVLGKRLGLIGLGNIGRQVARAAEALGMEIHFYDSRPVAQEIGQEMGWTRYETPIELAKESDLVSVHISAFDAWGQSNENCLDDVLPHIGANRPDGSPRIFLNLARGNVHSEQALLDAVASGVIRRAAVDVYPVEPAPGAPDWRNPYADEPRIVCTPHIGAATQEAQPRIARRVATTLGLFSRQGAVRDCVFEPRASMSLSPAPGQVVLAVAHSVSRGTKKAVDDAIFDSGASNLGSIHRDFPNGVAYDLSVLDKPLTADELAGLVASAESITGDSRAIRAIRQFEVPARLRW